MLNVGLKKLPIVFSVIVLMSLSFIFLMSESLTTTTLEPGTENVTDMGDIMYKSNSWSES